VSWRLGSVLALRDQSSRARTIELAVPGWPGHAAGQHVDVRLTAPDGYTAVRSYSIASAPDGDRLELTVEELDDGEVSPYLVRGLSVGDPLEIRGPIGGWFVWRPNQTEPIQLVAGGSGVVPLIAIARTHAEAGHSAPMRLLYSVREPAAALYRNEIEALASGPNAVETTYAYTRAAPHGWTGPVGRLHATAVAASTWPSGDGPTCYVCGPTGFVETVADLLVRAGHDPARVRTERFGGSGGARS
jgi:ferredoxin-NADP reductase